LYASRTQHNAHGTKEDAKNTFRGSAVVAIILKATSALPAGTAGTNRPKANINRQKKAIASEDEEFRKYFHLEIDTIQLME
jgi:hypothetical protein